MNSRRTSEKVLNFLCFQCRIGKIAQVTCAVSHPLRGAESSKAEDIDPSVNPVVTSKRLSRIRKTDSVESCRFGQQFSDRLARIGSVRLNF